VAFLRELWGQLASFGMPSSQIRFRTGGVFFQQDVLRWLARHCGWRSVGDESDNARRGTSSWTPSTLTMGTANTQPSRATSTTRSRTSGVSWPARVHAKTIAQLKSGLAFHTVAPSLTLPTATGSSSSPTGAPGGQVDLAPGEESRDREFVHAHRTRATLCGPSFCRIRVNTQHSPAIRWHRAPPWRQRQ
jgi:hypothetical protein